MIARQVDLVRGRLHRTCWLDDRPNLRSGVQVTLKGDPDRWTVSAVYDRMDLAKINRKWWSGGAVLD